MLSLVLALAVAPTPTAGSRWQIAVTELAAAEQAFSHRSAQVGIREAFMTYLADDAVVFQPGPLPGKQVYADVPRDTPASLAWEPEYVDLAASCDLGLSTGPYEYRPDRAKPEAASFGHFVSVWRRLDGVGWRVVVDAGGGRHLRSRLPVASVATGPPPTQPAALPSEATRASAENELAAAETEFWQAVAKRGASDAIAQVGADELRLYRERDVPVVGKNAALAALIMPVGTWETRRVGLGASLAGDFGYTWGTSHRRTAKTRNGADAESGGYLLVWKRAPGDRWRLVLFTASHRPDPS
jgi:ketosteroid isomerase-like protein